MPPGRSSAAAAAPSGSAAPPGRLKPILCAAAAAFAVALLGGLMTEIGPWYLNLKQPAWKPPDWAFGPIWTSIFAMAAASGAIAWWRTAPGGRERQALVLGFALNGFLNVFWSLLYFRLHRPDWALVEVVFLWLSVLGLIVLLRRRSPLSSWLLAPYLAWVSIASVLNLNTVQLNGPFGG